MPSNIMKPTSYVPKTLILMPPEVVQLEHAILHLVPMILSPLPDIQIVLESQASLVPSKKDPSPLLLMPKTGPLIPVVSLTTVEPHSITESYLLDILAPLG